MKSRFRTLLITAGVIACILVAVILILNYTGSSAMELRSHGSHPRNELRFLGYEVTTSAISIDFRSVYGGTVWVEAWEGKRVVSSKTTNIVGGGKTIRLTVGDLRPDVAYGVQLHTLHGGTYFSDIIRTKK